VKGTFTHNGQQAQIQASDTIRVIDKGGKPTKKGKK
jgi:hypothetical protein